MQPLSTLSANQQRLDIHRRQSLTLIAMCLALAVAALDDTVVNLALPILQTDLALSVEGLQWVLNAYFLPIACLVMSAGMLADVYGRRRIFLAGLVVFILGSVLAGLAANGQILIAARLLQGVGAAALLPGSLAILSDAYPNQKERTKAIGVWSGVSGLALIVGPVLGGVLVDTLGWRSIFFLNVPLGMVTLWLTVRAVPTRELQQHQISPEQLDWPGMLLSAVALASFITFLMGGTVSGLSGWMLGLVSLGSMITFFKVESVSAWPLLPLRLFSQPAIATAFIANALLFFMLISLMFLFSLFLQQIQGYSANDAGLRFLPLNATFIFASIVSGYFLARLGWRHTITAGFLLAGVAIISFSQVQAETPFSHLVFQLVLVGFGAGFTLSPLTAFGMSSLPIHQSGLAAALMNTSTRVGGALGIAVQGALFTHAMGGRLAKVLAEAGLGTDVKQAILAEAIAHGSTRPTQLMSSFEENGAVLSLNQLEAAIQQSFMAGMHSVIWTGAIALFIAAGLSWRYVRPPRQPD